MIQTTYVVFDKTGTLTKGVFQVTEICPDEKWKETAADAPGLLLEYAAYADSYSSHPISRSLKEAYGREIDKTKVAEVEEIGGHGVTAVVNGIQVAAGNAKLMRKLGPSCGVAEAAGTVVHLAIDGTYAG